MTPKELNEAIKKFCKDIKTGKLDPDSDGARKEFQRLYGADKEMKTINATSIRILLRLNLRYHWERLHMFGIYIEV